MSCTRPALVLAAVTLALTAAALARAQSAIQDTIKPAVPAEARLSKPANTDIRRAIRMEDSSKGWTTSQSWNLGIDSSSRRDAASWRFRGLLVETWPNAMGFTHASGSSSDDLLHSCESAVVPSRDSWRDYDRLGEAYAAAGDARRAIACYDKSVTLNPDNEAGLAKLLRLQNQNAVRQYSPHPYRVE
jgi:tetratricopeptide (TPR) repeat protein